MSYLITAAIIFAFASNACSSPVLSNTSSFSSTLSPSISTWSLSSDGPWSKREGLMAVSYNGALFISGGRSAYGVGFSSEVWRSTNDGVNWSLVSSGAFPARAYHVHLVVDNCMLITGGQTFLSFYNDVWESCDGEGKTWTKVLDHAPYRPRAGLAATVTSSGSVVVAAGCYNANGNPARRSFLSDVWSSSDRGRTWTLLNEGIISSFSARSGPRLVQLAESGRLLLVAGEVGFTSETQLQDIWFSDDLGATWQLLTDAPGFSARSGHGVVVVGGEAAAERVLVIGGWPHLHDLFESVDGGVTFMKTSDRVWNCESDNCGKFDFFPVVHNGDVYTVGGSAAFSTFGQLWQDTWRGSSSAATGEGKKSSFLRGAVEASK